MKKTIRKYFSALILYTNIIKLPLYYLFSLLTIKKNLIVFESNRGLTYSCNPKYIYEGMLKLDIQYICVWSFQDIKTHTKGKPVKVKRFSILYYYYLARAKYWVQNGEFGMKIKRRKGTTYINTQHGTPLKKMGVDIPYLTHRKKMFNKNKKWDYIISANKYTSDIWRRVYSYSGPILETGYPRNDIFYLKNNEYEIAKIKEKYRLPENKTVILYAPTFRDGEMIGSFSKNRVGFDFKINLDLFCEKLSKKYILILRLHHLIEQELDIEKYMRYVYNLSGTQFDIQELLLISDILITDYSSIIFDYSNLQRQILFYTYDIHEYKDSIRGMYLDLEKVAPGPLLYNNQELIESINNIDEISKKYEKKKNEFYKKYCYIDDGNATSRIINKVIVEN